VLLKPKDKTNTKLDLKILKVLKIDNNI
jgi:hypothetical protein